MLQYPFVVIGKIIVLVFLQSSMHYLQQLLLCRVVYLSNFRFYLIEPIFNRIELRRVRREIKNLNATLFSQTYCLVFIVDGTVVKNEPFLSLRLSLLLRYLLLFLFEASKQLLDEIQVFVLSISSLDYSPMSEAVIRNNGYQREAFSFGDGAINSDFLIWAGPSFVSGHIQIEPTLIKEVYFRVLHPYIFIFFAIVKSLLKRFSCVSLLRHALHSFLLEFTHFKQPGYSCPRNFNFLAIFNVFEIFDFVELYCQFILGQERVLFNEPCNMLQSFKGYFSLWSFLVAIFAINSLIKAWVLHPFCIKLMNSIITHIKELSYFSDIHFRPLVIIVIIIGIVLIEFLRKQFQCLFCQSLSAVLTKRRFQSSLTIHIDIQIFKLLFLFLHSHLLLLQLLFYPSCLLLHIFSFLFIHVLAFIIARFSALFSPQSLD